VIEVRGLSKHYGNYRAVQDVSFTVGEGEIVGFLGPNGAGKTTTIRILTCYHPATSGLARVAGYDVVTESMKVRNAVGYLPESVPLYTEMRVREYLDFRGKLRGLDRAQRQAAIGRVAERCWLKDVINRPIGQLSKGYRQRVGLADALLHNPPVLILDEPTVGLDPTQIRETRKLIKDLASEHTLMLSSHILPEVQATCQKIVIISKGRIVASGSPDELTARVSGESRLVLEARAPEPELSAAVRPMRGVTDLEVVSNDGWTRARIATPDDIREDLFRLCRDRNWPLRELRRDAATLEDFFVRIVAGAASKNGDESN
jgi:ABC-2 type transport system ATP-binding protein